MRLGAHLSVAPGLPAMAAMAVTLGCETVQIFSRSPRGGKPRELRVEEIAGMRAVLDGAGISPLAIHVPYFVNLASPDPRLYEYAVATVALDLERGRDLGAGYVITHPGSPGRGESPDAGLERVAAALLRLLEDAADAPGLLVEQTAGGGRQLGGSLEELAFLLRAAPVGLCLDTCHAFSSGYDLSREDGRQAFLGDVEEKIGLDRVKVVHLNDSLDPPGSRKDVHVRVGDGLLGEDAFRGLLQDPRLRGLPGVLETPRTEDGDLAEELGRLRRWRAE
ncbi:MAG: deoxyribonuclease IV [bacterium]|nr:deoxyribonuclease IV [bacterium]